MDIPKIADEEKEADPVPIVEPAVRFTGERGFKTKTERARSRADGEPATVLVRRKLTEKEKEMSPSELKDMLGVSRSTVWQARNRGYLYEKKSVSGAEEDQLKKEARRKLLLQHLVKSGIFRETQHGAVVDINSFEALKTGRWERRREQGIPSTFSRPEIRHLLQDELVVSEDEYRLALFEGRRPEAKRLFYLPDNKEHAFSPDYLLEQSDTSHLNLWQVGDDGIRAWREKFTLEDGSEIQLDELYLTKFVFGELGYRDPETGRIMVFDDEGNKREFSAWWLTRTYGDIWRTGERGKLSFGNSPLEYIRTFCPRLLTSGLYRVDDFRAMSEGAGRKFHKENTVSEKGLFYFDGARYSIGKKFAGMKVRSKDSGMAVVLSSSDDPHGSYVVLLASPDEIATRLREVGTKDRISFSRREGEHVFPYDERLSMESEEDYRARQGGFVGMKVLDELSQELTLEADMGIHRSLKWSEQLWVGKSITEDPERRRDLVEGARRYGTNFLRTFLSSSEGADISTDILLIARELPQALGMAVFAKYAELADAAAEVAKIVQVNPSQSGRSVDVMSGREKEVSSPDAERAQRVRALLIERAKKVLTDTARKFAQHASSLDGAQNKKENERVGRLPADDDRYSTTERDAKRATQSDDKSQSRVRVSRELIDELRALKKELITFAAMVKVRSAEPDFEPEEIVGTELAAVAGGSPELALHHESMRGIFHKNWAHKEPEVLAKLMTDFDRALSDPAQRFHLLTHQGRVASFVRFTKLENGNLYAGSYNVDPAVRGYKLGPTMFDTLLNREGREHVVEALSMPDQPMLPSYVNKNGFLIDEVRETEAGWQFHMRRDDRVRARLLGPRFPPARSWRRPSVEATTATRWCSSTGVYRDRNHRRSCFPAGGWFRASTPRRMENFILSWRRQIKKQK